MIHATPQPGYIFLERLPGAAFLIRAGQWANGDGFDDYEHCGIILEDGMLIEGLPGGAAISPLSDKDPTKLLFVSPPFLMDLQRKAICDAARSFEGVGYSYLDYVAIGAHRLHIPFPGLQNYIADSGHMICSQLCDLSYQLAGVQLFQDKRWPGLVTPGSIDRLLAV